MMRYVILAFWVPILLWSACSLYWIAGDRREGDGMRIACFLVSVPVVGINLWWLLGWQDRFAYQALLGIMAAAGFYTLLAMWTYGRGRRA